VDLEKARKPSNARSETIAESGMFRAAFVQRRCLVPAPAYYEWRDDPDGKTPFAVARIDGDPVAFGGPNGKQIFAYRRTVVLSGAPPNKLSGTRTS
jgi:putative SOS response-associated peptidase YedK